MKLKKIIEWVEDKTRFKLINDYISFTETYLEYIQNELQAVIVSQNENHYQFFQYKKEGNFATSRPINSNLMFSANDFLNVKDDFNYALSHIREIENDKLTRETLNRFVYTCQQSIGATLDALPAKKSNKARKINGDLFERYIRLIISQIGIPVRDETVYVPVIIDGEKAFKMSYQHDLIIGKNEIPNAIGSVKTSSKDRIDKIFIDKFLHNRLTSCETPHFAVFLNDVQRKGKESKYGINTTFLTGRFKGYTIKLNPLDGVYYCDLRPNMQTDTILKEHIRSLDCLLVKDIWEFVE